MTLTILPLNPKSYLGARAAQVVVACAIVDLIAGKKHEPGGLMQTDYIGGSEKDSIGALYRDYIRVIWGLYREYIEIILYRGHIGIIQGICRLL